MKKSLFFVVFISLVFFATTVSAEEISKDSKSEVQQDIIVDPSWELIEVSVDEETGTMVEIYHEKMTGYSLIDIMNNGRWDWVANSYWNTDGMTVNANLNTQDKVVKSTGGDFMISVYPHQVVPYGAPDAGMRLQMYEKDTFGSDKVGGEKIASPNQQFAVHVIYRGIGGYVDGGEAEFFVKYGVNYHSPDDFLVVYSD
ncbi:hypothetical protein CIL03_10010 [Virgibacillus indicus]|uniref:Uncharacterized protein n=1 Tax=Virgibacillus indicus TaxID=2024554 RepID=A0A265NAY3_9BACI|nr:hypothetical protein [Virgibacillus indicus]OZU88624.1 hypothetical protein CIL03_10010 [Virgibacillus indicus]